VQAQKEGAPADAVQAAQQQVMLMSLSAALQLIGVELPSQKAKSLARRKGRIMNRSMRQAANQKQQPAPSASTETPYHYRTAIPLRFSYLDRRDGQLTLCSTHNYGYFSCLSTILWDLITCSNYGKRPTRISSANGMKDFKDKPETELFQYHFAPPEQSSLHTIPKHLDLPIPAHHGDYQSLDINALSPLLMPILSPLIG